MCLSTKRADNNGGSPEFPFLILYGVARLRTHVTRQACWVSKGTRGRFRNLREIIHDDPHCHRQSRRTVRQASRETLATIADQVGSHSRRECLSTADLPR